MQHPSGKWTNYRLVDIRKFLMLLQKPPTFFVGKFTSQTNYKLVILSCTKDEPVLIIGKERLQLFFFNLFSTC